MFYSNIKLKGLKTSHDCSDAIDKIERDPRNYSSGIARWNRGGECTLRTGAVKKIAGINRKLHSFPDGDE